MTDALQITPIGVIHTPFGDKQQAPVQGVFTDKTLGEVEVFDEFAEGLLHIEGFSHLILIYHFDRAGDIKLVRTTFLDDAEHGLFATRHPCRPSAIGITVVKLMGRNGNRLQVSGVDMLDQTPLLDIKPYVTRFDCFPDAADGWISGKPARNKPPDRE